MKVGLFATLRTLVGSRHVELDVPETCTVREIVHELVRRWPALQSHIFDEAGGLGRHVNVLIDGRNVRWLDGIESTVGPGQVIDIFPPVAGG